MSNPNPANAVFSIGRKKEPIRVEIFGVDYQLPIFDRRARNAWRKELDDEREKRAMAELPTPEQRARMRLAYPIAPLTNAEFDEYMTTDPGVVRVFETSAKRASVPDDVINRVLEGEGIDDNELQIVSYMLAGITDPVKVAARMQAQAKNGKDDADGSKGGEGDPLPDNAPG